MRHFSRHGLMLLASLAIFAVAVTLPGTAVGQTCGGADPCGCGDQVTSSRTLVPGVDPVTTTTCDDRGLVISDEDGVSPVTLDLGGATLRGSGAAAGIEISKSTLVTVRNGRVIGFESGIVGNGASDSLVTNVQVLDNTATGILFGPLDGNVIEKCIVRRNGGVGVSVSGNNNTVRLCRIELNGGTGLIVDGTNNDILRNIVYTSGGDGIHIKGTGTAADRNQAKYNDAEGFLVEGSDHTLTLNIANSNGTDGFTVYAVNSRFERNTANSNGRPEHGQPADGYGIRDTTTGDGTAGTDNTYEGNRCTGNGLGDSSPAGLCS